ncbi:MAG: hypothetical protein C3F02_02180 [Parcubacteria group bacterium]|nr:MAG: hypothetical protein C3F02_02180 [Parcubacteria group bacterium]
MNLWSIISVILITLGLSPARVSYLSTVEVFNQGTEATANIQRVAVDNSLVLPQRKNLSSLGVKISASSAAVMDEASETVLWQKSAKEIRSIASISKLMTALVFLEHNPGWDNKITMLAEDEVGADTPNILQDEEVTVKNLFFTALVGSDNNATRALVRSTGLSLDDFVKLMNDKAKQMGLVNTYFADPIGLNSQNSSTALEVLKLAKTAFNNKDIDSATTLKVYNFNAPSGKNYKIKSTNYLLSSYLKVKNGKTGSTDQAGYCLVVKVAGRDKQNIITVVLGSDNQDDRFKDAKILSAWTLENFSWL